MTTPTGTGAAVDEAEPGFGFVTVSDNVVPAWLAVAVPLARSSVPETTVVFSAAPASVACAPAANPVPRIVMVNEPASMTTGTTAATVGTALSSVAVTLALFVGSAVLTALTLMALFAGTVAGAV